MIRVALVRTDGSERKGKLSVQRGIKKTATWEQFPKAITTLKQESLSKLYVIET